MRRVMPGNNREKEALCAEWCPGSTPGRLYSPVCTPRVYLPVYSLPIPPWVYLMLYLTGVMYVGAVLGVQGGCPGL